MKDIIIKINKETRMVNLSKTTIGNDGENLQGNFIFEFEDDFVDGQARLEYEIWSQKNYIVLNKEKNSYTTPIKNVITKHGTINMQLVITEGTNGEEIPVFKSNKFYLYCNASINAIDEAPDGYELWIEVANVKLNEIDNIDIDITTNNDSTMVEITRKDGTKKSAIVSGSTGVTTANNVKFEDGTTFQEKYDSGELKGEPGADGKTPVKGVDYFTTDDKQELVDLVLAEIPSAEGVGY